MKKEIEKEKILSSIAYIGPISLCIYLLSDNKYVVFHSKQALRLFIYYLIPLLILSILSKLKILWRLTDILSSIIIVVAIILSAQGIINALNNKQKKLPLINKLIKKG